MTDKPVASPEQVEAAKELWAVVMDEPFNPKTDYGLEEIMHVASMLAARDLEIAARTVKPWRERVVSLENQYRHTHQANYITVGDKDILIRAAALIEAEIERLDRADRRARAGRKGA